MAREKDMTVRASRGGKLIMDGQIVDIEAPDAKDANAGGSGPGGPHMKFAGRLIARAKGGAVKARGDRLLIDGAGEAIVASLRIYSG
jgi:alpha-L-fucosidase 2